MTLNIKHDLEYFVKHDPEKGLFVPICPIDMTSLSLGETHKRRAVNTVRIFILRNFTEKEESTYEIP